MGTEIVFHVQESSEGGYEARALGHSIFTEADSADGIKDAVRDAVRCHFGDEEPPRIVRLHFVRVEVSGEKPALPSIVSTDPSREQHGR